MFEHKDNQGPHTCKTDNIVKRYVEPVFWMFLEVERLKRESLRQ